MLTPLLFFGGCGNSDDASDFGDHISAFHTTHPHQRDYVMHNELNTTQANAYIAHGSITAPLEGVVINSSVLDQGVTNSSATLSAVGAIGLLLEGDARYFSATCSLNLGNYLMYNDNYNTFEPLNTVVQEHQLSHYPSGWHGSYVDIIMTQISEFGLQYQTYCGFDSFYGEEHINMVSPQEYEKTSFKPEIVYNEICSNFNRNVSDCQCLDSTACTTSDAIIGEIKTIIDSEGLALVGTALFANAGNYGLLHAYYLYDASGMAANVWDYTDKIRHCRTQSDDSCHILTHDMIVFGYIDGNSDDDGLLVLRTSWGVDAGDEGNYYMSYKYAKNMLLSIQSLYTEKNGS